MPSSWDTGVGALRACASSNVLGREGCARSIKKAAQPLTATGALVLPPKSLAGGLGLGLGLGCGVLPPLPPPVRASRPEMSIGLTSLQQQ